MSWKGEYDVFDANTSYKDKMNTLAVINEIIKEVLNTNNISIEVSDDTKLIQDCALDSLMAIEILVSVEERLNIVINDDELDIALLETPKTLLEYVERKLSE